MNRVTSKITLSQALSMVYSYRAAEKSMPVLWPEQINDILQDDKTNIAQIETIYALAECISGSVKKIQTSYATYEFMREQNLEPSFVIMLTECNGQILKVTPQERSNYSMVAPANTCFYFDSQHISELGSNNIVLSAAAEFVKHYLIVATGEKIQALAEKSLDTYGENLLSSVPGIIEDVKHYLEYILRTRTENRDLCAFASRILCDVEAYKATGATGNFVFGLLQEAQKVIPKDSSLWSHRLMLYLAVRDHGDSAVRTRYADWDFQPNGVVNAPGKTINLG